MSDPALAEMLHNSLYYLYLVLNENDRYVFARYGLTIPRFYALQHLNNEPGMSFARLSDLMLTDRANVTRIVRSMELDGLIERRLNEEDRRSFQLQLTEKGAALYAQATAAHQSDIRARFKGSHDLVDEAFVTRLRALQRELDEHLKILKQSTSSPAQERW